MISVDGKVLGDHDGLFYYTIGQRKGLGIGGEGDAWFVVDKNIENNTLIVAQGENHPSLFAKGVKAYSLSWVDKKPEEGKEYTAKIRYRQKDEKCFIEKIEND